MFRNKIDYHPAARVVASLTATNVTQRTRNTYI